MSVTLKPLSELTGALAALEAAKPAPGAVTLRYEVELITPMMGGGVLAGTPDNKGLLFRTRSLRGQLRMWWRVLARSGLLQSLGDPLPSTPAQWRTAERAVWGGMSDNESRTDRPVASAVGLWINPQWISAPVLISYKSLIERVPGLKYALFPAQPTKAEESLNQVDGKNLVRAGAKFELRVTVKDAHLAGDIGCVIAHWATFGGLGARTRRGLGAVKVKQFLHDEYLCVLQLDGWVDAIRGIRSSCVNQGETHYRDATDRVQAVSLQQAFWSAYARGPVLNSGEAALALGIQKLQEFRQGPGIGRNDGFGLSWWPEAHILRDKSNYYLEKHSPKTSNTKPFAGANCWPRADFGLPIVMHFKDADGPTAGHVGDQAHRDPATRTLLPDLPGMEGADRMASPLILRAVASPSGNLFMPVALLLNIAKLEGREGRLLEHARVDPAAGATTTLPVWSDALAGLGANTPLCKYGRGAAFPVATSAVEAFLNYFVSRGA